VLTVLWGAAAALQQRRSPGRRRRGRAALPDPKGHAPKGARRAAAAPSSAPGRPPRRSGVGRPERERARVVRVRGEEEGRPRRRHAGARRRAAHAAAIWAPNLRQRQDRGGRRTRSAPLTPHRSEPRRRFLEQRLLRQALLHCFEPTGGEEQRLSSEVGQVEGVLPQRAGDLPTTAHKSAQTHTRA